MSVVFVVVICFHQITKCNSSQIPRQVPSITICILLFTLHFLFKSSIKPPSQPQVFVQALKHNYYQTIGPDIFPYPNALLLKLLLLLFPSYGAEESSIKQSSAASWSAGLITLVHTGFPVKSSLKRQTCVCASRIELCLYLCTARQIT